MEIATPPSTGELDASRVGQVLMADRGQLPKCECGPDILSSDMVLRALERCGTPSPLPLYPPYLVTVLDAGGNLRHERPSMGRSDSFLRRAKP